MFVIKEHWIIVPIYPITTFKKEKLIKYIMRIHKVHNHLIVYTKMHLLFSKIVNESKKAHNSLVLVCYYKHSLLLIEFLSAVCLCPFACMHWGFDSLVWVSLRLVWRGNERKWTDESLTLSPPPVARCPAGAVRDRPGRLGPPSLLP